MSPPNTSEGIRTRKIHVYRALKTFATPQNWLAFAKGSEIRTYHHPKSQTALNSRKPSKLCNKDLPQNSELLCPPPKLKGFAPPKPTPDREPKPKKLRPTKPRRLLRGVPKQY